MRFKFESRMDKEMEATDQGRAKHKDEEYKYEI
jgi:hypothetical protein